MRTKKFLVAGAAALALTLSACAPNAAAPAPAPGTAGSTGAAAPANITPVKVDIIYSKTGPLAAYGETFYQGFQAGLDYATKGTGEVNGRKLEITYTDDAGNADKAVAAAKDSIGNGTKIMGGTVVSGVALKLAEQAAQNKVLYISGPAATDAVTGINKYTFRSGRQSLQDVATAADGIESGAKVTVFAQNNAFGQGNVAAVKAVLGAKGAEIAEVLVPEDVTEFTPFARQLVAAKPDMVFVAWAGATSGAMWQALSQQGVLENTKVVTGLGDRSTYGAYGAASDKITFLNHYFPGAANNAVEKAMIDAVEKAGAKPDLFTPDGFVAAQMIVHAVEKGGGDDVDKMVEALEGWEFDAPKGKQQVRAADHAMIQPMFQAKLVKDGDSWKPELVSTVDGAKVAPAEKKIG